MGLETGTYINDLVSSNPLADDPRKQGDDHLRLIKSVLQNTFPGATRGWRFPRFATKTANYTILSTDDETLFIVDTSAGNVTITLPVLTISTLAWKVHIVKATADANTVALSGTVNGDTLATLTKQGQSYHIGWNGTAYYAFRGSPPLDASIATAALQDAAVTLAKMANLAAKRSIGSTAGGVPAALSIEEQLNWIGTPARGDILRQGATSVERLAKGTSGQALRSDGTDTVWAHGDAQLLHLRDTYSNGVTANSLIINTWNKRRISDIVTDEISISISNDQITFPAGTYTADLAAAAGSTAVAGFIFRSQLRLRNITGGSTILVGMSAAGGGAINPGQGADAIQVINILKGRFTLGSTTVVEIQHWVGGSSVMTMGQPATSGESEIYADFIFRRVA